MNKNPDSVLLVDDDAMVRKMVKAALEQRGLQVTDVGSGQAAIDAFDARRPDIVLLDAMMPELDGFATCRRLRALPDGEHVPVIMLTGLDDDESIARAYESGATDFFIKSPQMTLLAERIRYLLRTSRMREELARSRTKLAMAQRIARLGSWEWDFASGNVTASEECFRILGLQYTEAGVPESDFLTAFYPDGVDAFRFQALAGLKTGRSHRFEGTVHTNVGQRQLDVELDAERDAASHIVRIIGTIQDITDRRNTEEHVRRLANYDSLTGLANRNLFRSRFEEAVGQARQARGRVAALVINLDRYKIVNDTLGHAAGDGVLREVASRLNRSVRSRNPIVRGYDGENTAVARLGGDEFVVLLTELSEREDAGRVAERILEALRRPVLVEGQECWVTASIGIAVFPEDGDGGEELLAHADAAMQDAKATGRNAWRAFNSGMAMASVERLRVEGDLRKALERDELRLHWQPIVDVGTGRIAGAEALMRWHRGEKLVSPMEFIGLAEETGLIIPMAEWALDTACRQLRSWTDMGLDPIYASVNITSKHVQQRDLFKVVQRVLESAGLPPERLALEITETGLMDFVEPTLRILNALRDQGVKVAIDDFGTGYSSLSYLKRLPISMLKIDRAFVKDVIEDSDDRAIVSAICGMARSLGLAVVAEGVENEAQSMCLGDFGIKLMQGYHFSRPVPAERFETLLRSTSGGTLRADWIHAGHGRAMRAGSAA
jgi:diguanylate cyclase (GGDEF)-like protein